MSTDPDITRQLALWRGGDRHALQRLSDSLLPELRRIARRHLKRERKDHSMQASSLVQEAFLRLMPRDDHSPEAGWRDRAHFFAVASTVMRHVLVDHARGRSRNKRGGTAVHVPIEKAVVMSQERVEEIVLIDLALRRLEAIDERKSRVLEMRFFGGLSVEETAEALGVAPNTVTRDWNFACAWLRRELVGAEDAGNGSLETD